MHPISGNNINLDNPFQVRSSPCDRLGRVAQQSLETLIRLSIKLVTGAFFLQNKNLVGGEDIQKRCVSVVQVQKSINLPYSRIEEKSSCESNDSEQLNALKVISSEKIVAFMKPLDPYMNFTFSNIFKKMETQEKLAIIDFIEKGELDFIKDVDINSYKIKKIFSNAFSLLNFGRGEMALQNKSINQVDLIILLIKAMAKLFSQSTVEVVSLELKEEEAYACLMIKALMQFSMDKEYLQKSLDFLLRLSFKEKREVFKNLFNLKDMENSTDLMKYEKILGCKKTRS